MPPAAVTSSSPVACLTNSMTGSSMPSRAAASICSTSMSLPLTSPVRVFCYCQVEYSLKRHLYPREALDWFTTYGWKPEGIWRKSCIYMIPTLPSEIRYGMDRGFAQKNICTLPTSLPWLNAHRCVKWLSWVRLTVGTERHNEQYRSSHPQLISRSSGWTLSTTAWQRQLLHQIRYLSIIREVCGKSLEKHDYICLHISYRKS